MEMLRYRLFQEIKQKSFNADSPIALITRAMELIDYEQYDDENKHRILLMTIQSFTSPDPLFAEDNENIPGSCIQKIKIMMDQKILEETILMLDGVAKGKRLPKPKSMLYNYASYVGSSVSYLASYLTVPYYYYYSDSRPLADSSAKEHTTGVIERKETTSLPLVEHKEEIKEYIEEPNIVNTCTEPEPTSSVTVTDEKPTRIECDIEPSTTEEDGKSQLLFLTFIEEYGTPLESSPRKRTIIDEVD